MTKLDEAEQSAIDAVARYFSAEVQKGEGPPEAYLTVGGRNIALDVAVLSHQSPRSKPLATARLRDDAVARRVLRDVETALTPHVPNGKTLILTLGAPIKVPSKLITALLALLVPYLERGTEEVDEKKTLLGNRVRFRVLSHTSKWNAKFAGFVFSGDPAPEALATAMRSLHDAIAAPAKKRMPAKFAGDRWLVVASAARIADIKTYQRACLQLSPTHPFKKLLMVFEGGSPLDLGADLDDKAPPNRAGRSPR